MNDNKTINIQNSSLQSCFRFSARTLAAFTFFGALTGIFLWKLWPVWDQAIPGGLQDTRLFLWNAWWYHHALAELHTNPFRTDLLFHPYGTSLISHDFPLWMNLITDLGQRAGMTLIASSNLWFAISWLLNGFCTYGLAREVLGPDKSRAEGPALVAGVYAITHSYGLARAMQNWGQFNFYGIALFLWCLLRARRKKRPGSWVLAGMALAWTAACHYYFLIYSVLLWCAVALYDLSPYGMSFTYRAPGKMVRVMLVSLSALAGAAALAIFLRPGEIVLGAARVSLRSTDNPLFLMWVFLIMLLVAGLRVRIHLRMSDPLERRRLLVCHAVLVGVSALCLSPLVWESLWLIRQGGYPQQSILWKTHLTGANLFSLLMPNPLQIAWGPAVSQWFVSRGLNPQEQAASIGWVCLTILLLAKIWQKRGVLSRWLALALSATVLALGTHLHVAEHNTWLPLPFLGPALTRAGQCPSPRTLDGGGDGCLVRCFGAGACSAQ